MRAGETRLEATPFFLLTYLRTATARAALNEGLSTGVVTLLVLRSCVLIEFFERSTAPPTGLQPGARHKHLRVFGPTFPRWRAERLIYRRYYQLPRLPLFSDPSLTSATLFTRR